ncbi:MAG TPA: DNA-protecting protein DprA [Gammaproteobacteria bacterium]|nr:DNA-protecting protein DprA [Gammaproteobacteria bacterium]HCZ48431.1 DNA-protecting protein DprA [Gammaproteobacteria bacterium]MCH77869.1 DNA-protecting protein DprA [Gammaproteobacteria bacterium]
MTLARTPGLGAVGWRRLLATFGDAQAVLCAPSTHLLECLGGNRRLVRAVQSAAANPPVDDLAWLQQGPQRQVVFLDRPGYPSRLAQIPDPPPAVLVQGDVALLDGPQLAIVGSRNATPVGRDTAYMLAAALAEAGLTVTSGLAEGIDASAHRGALAGGGATIAVLGTGPDRIYPRQHQELAQTIGSTGSLISEQPVGTPPRGFNFPRRNRIISGLSLGVLVVEAGARSGSLITARLAADQGREVFAVPGGIHNPLTRGCHALIREGAKLVESVADILVELPPLPGGHTVHAAPSACGAEPDPVLANLGDAPASLDLLVQRTGLTVEEVSTMLLTLQLDGLVTALPGGLYGRRGPRQAR